MTSNKFLLHTIKDIKEQAEGIVKVIGAIQRDKEYVKGSVVFFADRNILNLNWLLECEQRGRTDSKPVRSDQLLEGELIQDGDVLWRVKRWTYDNNVPGDAGESTLKPGDVYTRAEANEHFVSIDIYNNCVHELEDAIAKKAARGEKGDQGIAGESGKSAYEIAKVHGFTGTEAEWLESLKGTPGEVPDTENLATKEELAAYAKKTDIPAQKNLTELGGVTKNEVQSIIEGMDFLSADAIKSMIDAAATKDINEWKTNTVYDANTLVLYNQSLYLCLARHNASFFDDDFAAGYWKQIDSKYTAGSGTTNYVQETFQNVTAPKEIKIALANTNNFCLPPVEALKAGTQETNVSVKCLDFSESDKSMYKENDKVMFTNTGLELNTNYEVTASLPVALGKAGYISESDCIDLNDYKNIEDID